MPPLPSMGTFLKELFLKAETAGGMESGHHFLMSESLAEERPRVRMWEKEINME